MCGYNPCDESCGYGSYNCDDSYDYCRPRRRCHPRKVYVEVYEYDYSYSNCCN